MRTLLESSFSGNWHLRMFSFSAIGIEHAAGVAVLPPLFAQLSCQLTQCGGNLQLVIVSNFYHTTFSFMLLLEGSLPTNRNRLPELTAIPEKETAA